MTRRSKLPLALFALFMLLIASACKVAEVEGERLFITPDPRNSPGEVKARILEESQAPMLSEEHFDEAISLCLSCHSEEGLKVDNPNLTISHKVHFAKGIVCYTCHGSLESARVETPRKENCISCHAKKGISTGCKTCHTDTEILKPESHQSADFSSSHGKLVQGIVSCQECHGQTTYCVDCHGVRMPHPDDFITIHPSRIQGEPLKCAKCHGVRSCEKCHTERGVEF